MKVNLIVGTTNNNAPIQMVTKKVAQALIQPGKEPDGGILNMIEMAFRAFDPCYSCATHSLPGQMPLSSSQWVISGKLPTMSAIWRTHSRSGPRRAVPSPDPGCGGRMLLRCNGRGIIERGADYLLDRCRMIGPLTGTWAEAMHQTRGPQSLRVMQGLLHLAGKHPAADLEKAARVAIHHGTWRLRDLKRLLALPGNVVQMDFLESHPLIRSLEAYRIELNTNQNTNPNS